MKKKEGSLIFLICALFNSCDQHEKKITYYKDGKNIEHIQEYKGSVKDGEEIYYYPDGNVMVNGIWSNGKKQGVFFTYYNTGSLSSELNFYKDVLVGEARFFLNDGTLEKVRYYDSLGRVTDTKKFNSDGSRNQSIEFIWRMKSDTIKMHDTISFSFSVGNISNFLYLKGTFYRGDNFIKGVDNNVLLLKDTLEKIDSKDNCYSFNIIANRGGANYIRGLLAFKLPNDSVDVFAVQREYFVK